MRNKIKIKAAVLEKNFNPLVIKNIFFKNSLKKNQVLVKIFYSGICGSQIGEINAVKGKDKFLPHLLGHEATGKVVKTYDKNSKFKTGNIVILHWQKSKLTDSQLPVYYDSNKKRINAGWVTTFNNYAVISENRLTKLPKGISKIDGLLFGCGLTTAYGALFGNINLAKLKSKKILVTGYGMIGQILIKLINKTQVDQITVIENNNKKLNLLKKDYKKIKIFKNMNSVKKNLFDFAFDTTGQGKLIESAYKSIKNNGKLILIGVPHHSQKIKINTLGINYGKKIIGSYGGNVNPNIDIPKIAKFIKKNKINLRKFLCGPYKFSQINKVLNKIQKGQIIKKPIIKF